MESILLVGMVAVAPVFLVGAVVAFVSTMGEDG